MALSRSKDMLTHDYFGHTNSFTGECPDNMNLEYGFAPDEYPVEKLSMHSLEHLSHGEAIDMWIFSPDHNGNLLWPTHYSGGRVV